MLTYKDNHIGAGNYWPVLLAGMLWGTTGTAQAFLPAGTSPLSVGAVRLAVGGLILLLIVLSKEGIKGIKGPWPIKPTITAVLGVVGFQACFFCAVLKTGVVTGTMISAGTAPIFAGILGYLFEKEKLTKKWLFSTVLGIVGVILLTISKPELDADITGVLLALAASMLYSVYGLGIKKMSINNSSTGTMAVILSLGTVLILPAYLVLDFSWMATPQGLGISLYLGIVATAIAYSLFARGISRIPISSTYTLSLSEPLTACLLGVLLLGEKLSPVSGGGIILLFAGLIILSLPANLFNFNPRLIFTNSNAINEEVLLYKSLYRHNSQTIAAMWLEYQKLAEEGKTATMQYKLKNLFRYGIISFSFYEYSQKKVLTDLQRLYFERRIEELEENIKSLNKLQKSHHFEYAIDEYKETTRGSVIGVN